MGSLYSLSLLALLLVAFVDQICGCEVKNEKNYCFVEGTKPSERAFGEGLETFLQAILKKGIPDLGIPPLDPLVYNDNISISETDMPGMMTIEYLELGHFEVVGLSTFENHFLDFDLNQLAIILNLTFPIKVKAEHSNFSIIVGDLIPFNGEGPANLIAALRVEAEIYLNRTSEGYVCLDDLIADIFFDSLEVDFTTLMGVTGGRENHIFNKLMGDVTPELIDLMKPYMIDGILESLLTTANEFLESAKIKYTDIIYCLMGNPNCPFDLS